MPLHARPRAARRRGQPYHHGDLRRALLEEALRTIETEGVEGLTLRAVGEKLGVSRTALYRHFSDKQALLAAVSREGFRALRTALAEAWEDAGRGQAGFEAMGAAYVHFAVGHSAHYRVMFGRFLESCSKDDRLIEEATNAFQVLVTALVERQQAGVVRRDDPVLVARLVWSIVHGIAMLMIDGQLPADDEQRRAFNRYALERIRAAIQAE